MAFPTVQTADTKNGTVTSNSTSWTLTYPTNLASGDLIIACVATDGDNATVAPTWPAGWVHTRAVAGTAVTLLIAKKLSDGTETGTFTLTLNSNEQGGWRIYRITGWEGTLGTSFAGPGNVNVGAVDAAFTSGASANPDPPNLDPVNWATEDTLWIAAIAVDTSRTISVYPLADLNTADVSGGANGATLGVCMADSAVSSLNPSTYTISASDDWVSVTIAVRPAAAAAPLVLEQGYVDHANPGLLMKGWIRERLSGLWRRPDIWLPDGSLVA